MSSSILTGVLSICIVSSIGLLLSECNWLITKSVVSPSHNFLIGCGLWFCELFLGFWKALLWSDLDLSGYCFSWEEHPYRHSTYFPTTEEFSSREATFGWTVVFTAPIARHVTNFVYSGWHSLQLVHILLCSLHAHCNLQSFVEDEYVL